MENVMYKNNNLENNIKEPTQVRERSSSSVLKELQILSAEQRYYLPVQE